MIPSGYRQLVDKLAEKTRAKKANWRTTSNENAYIINFGNFSITINRSTFNDINYITITLYDSDGKEIDDFSISEGSSSYVDLKEVFILARRKARNIDIAIDAISSALDTDGEVGETDDNLNNDILPF